MSDIERCIARLGRALNTAAREGDTTECDIIYAEIAALERAMEIMSVR